MIQDRQKSAFLSHDSIEFPVLAHKSGLSAHRPSKVDCLEANYPRRWGWWRYVAAAAVEARGGCAPLPVVWARTVHALRGWREPRGELVPVCAEIASGHHARVRIGDAQRSRAVV